MAFTNRSFGRCCLFLSAGILLALTSLRADDLARRSVRCDRWPMEYLLFVPPGQSSTPLPTVLLLHGAGDQAEHFIRAWESFAREKKIILIAPQLPRDLKFEPDAPKVYRCLIEDAGKVANLDSHRLYLFGHSMGGYLAYDGALLDSEYFAAAAIHAMGIDDDYVAIIGHATRKIPIAIYMGTKDQMVSLTQVRKTEALLRKSGFPLHYQEMPEHDHNYYDLADVINRDAWHFLEGYRTP
jgi:poly(3-hydroxybutyrate) depolymerase